LGIVEEDEWGGVGNLIVFINSKPKEKFQFVKIVTFKDLLGYINYFKPVLSSDETLEVAEYLLELNNHKIYDKKSRKKGGFWNSLFVKNPPILQKNSNLCYFCLKWFKININSYFESNKNNIHKNLMINEDPIDYTFSYINFFDFIRPRKQSQSTASDI